MSPVREASVCAASVDAASGMSIAGVPIAGTPIAEMSQAAVSDTAVSDTAASDTAVSDTAVSDTAVSDTAASGATPAGEPAGGAIVSDPALSPASWSFATTGDPTGAGGTGVLRVGTRGSALALAQSGQIAGRIAAHAGARTDLVTVRTEGDVNLGPLAAIGGTGVFVTGVRAALLAGRVDVVVHSLKDLPTAPADGIALAAVPVRENPFDALCARDGLTLDTLPVGARVGTGSPRRAAQLRLRRPDLDVVPVRGNVDTRLGLVTSGTVDAVVLAVAGLARLGRQDRITQQFGPDDMLPAPAQGALAVEALAGPAHHGPFADALRAVDDPEARAAVLAERTLLSTLEAGCTAPLGAFADVRGGELTLTGTVIAVDGAREIRDRVSGPIGDGRELGAELALRMLSAGAAALLAEPRA